ncbi:MAG TPA: ribulose-phosphate 3-epimerase [Thermomicrobiales bacterium]|nr:ribulose-phosphate 3-epimerase [Thermomicrobiales bacterium]
MIERDVWIGPSIMTADLLRLGEQVAAAEQAGVNYMHLDVMDGRFVPNISFGVPVASALRKATTLPVDAHLMIVEPEKYVEQFVDAGADRVTVHVEACRHLHSTLKLIADAGAMPSVSLNPATPLVALEEVLPIVGQVLVMSVNPGFGGQSFIPLAIDKIRRLRAMIDERNPDCRLQVDGGIKASNIRRVIEAGADTIVAGSAIYNREQSVAESVAALREALR